MNEKGFNFYYGKEAEQFSFYRIPKLLFIDKRFKDVSVDAKVLYGLLLDRMSLSLKNGWVDEENRVYIYFKLEDVIEFLAIGKDKGVKLFAELDDEKGCGLIKRIRQGPYKPMMIYVKNFNSTKAVCDDVSNEADNIFQTSEKEKSIELEKTEVLTSKKPKSCIQENRSYDFGKAEANNTKINNTKNINTEYSDSYPIISYKFIGNIHINDAKEEMKDREKIRKTLCKNINYACLCEQYGADSINGIVEIMLDVICSKKTFIIVNGEEIPQAAVKNRLLKLTDEHISYVLDCLKQSVSNVRNMKSYMLTALYNAYSTIDHYYTAKVNYDLYGRKREEINKV